MSDHVVSLGRLSRALALAAVAVCARAEAKGLWIFGEDVDAGNAPSAAESPQSVAEKPAEPRKARSERVSDLIAPVTDLVDLASDLASTGTVAQAVKTYREALSVLDRIEAEDPERAKRPEFSTIRTKRAYIEAAIASLQFDEVRNNAKSVTVSDTADLERRRAAEKKPSRAVARTRQEVLSLLAEGRLDEAGRACEEVYARNTNDVAVLNLRAVVAAERGKFAVARACLDRAIRLAPDDYVAYYNMARILMRQDPPDKETARGYFADGCALGGPKNERLEKLLR